MMVGTRLETRATPLDHALVVVFLIGIYLGVAAHLPGGVPVPAVVAGAAGGLLLVKHIGRIGGRQFIPFVVVMLVFVLSILTAPDYSFLRERFKGFVQLAYSLLITTGFLLALVRYERETLSRLFLSLCLFIVVGCTLENYVGPFRDLSDSFRRNIFDYGLYVADLRDQLFYGRIRPKLFTSEPSSVTFVYTVFAFAWYVLSTARHKLLSYVALIAVGYWLMRGPSLLLGLAAVPFYKIMLQARRGPPWAVRYDGRAVVTALVAAVVLASVAVIAGLTLYEERVAVILSGHDPSFFSRIVAPYLTAARIVQQHPLSGAGLTGWEYIEPLVFDIYANADSLSTRFYFPNVADGVTNYFWLHWIFLGLFWGAVAMMALSWYLRTLGVPSIVFCWGVWAIFGQSSGGYVDPRTWIVLMLAGAIAIVHERQARGSDAYRLLARTPSVRHARPAGPGLAPVAQ